MNDKHDFMYPDFYHIGLPKTGTTTIQYILKNDERINLIHNRYFSSKEWWLKEFDYYKNNSVNIVSEENQVLQTVGGVNIINFLKRVSEVNSEAKIIVTIREQRSLLKSRYKYHIPYFEGYAGSFKEWLLTNQGLDYIGVCMYGTLYKAINLYFSQDNIYFLLYEDLKYNYDEFIKELYNIMKLEMKKGKRRITKNESLSDNEVYIIKILNKYKIFRKNIFISHYETYIFKYLAKKFERYVQAGDTFSWTDNKLFRNIEKEFIADNKLFVRNIPYIERKMRKYNYLL